MINVILVITYLQLCSIIFRHQNKNVDAIFFVSCHHVNKTYTIYECAGFVYLIKYSIMFGTFLKTNQTTFHCLMMTAIHGLSMSSSFIKSSS